MNDIKMYLTSKNFVVSSMVLKNISRLNINMDEFLLLLYFMNVKNQLDIEDIKKYLCFDEETILNTFNELVKGTLVEIQINKVDGKIEEKLSLDPFYNKIILTIEDTEAKNNNNDIYATFEKEFGRTLSPIEFETINSWLENKISEEIIIKALKQAVISGTPNLRYIDRIIYRWNKDNVINGNKEFKPLFDYDWLGESNEK